MAIGFEEIPNAEAKGIEEAGLGGSVLGETGSGRSGSFGEAKGEGLTGGGIEVDFLGVHLEEGGGTPLFGQPKLL